MAERISFDRVADVYDETRGLPPTPLAKAIGVLAEELQGKRVLEIGVGTGRYTVPLQKSGIDVVGVDIAPKMVARGLEKGMRNIVFADGARLPFGDGTFDAVTSNHVLHLIPDWRHVLGEAFRVLRSDGLYFSLFERHHEPSLTDRYREVANALGFTRPDAGIHERDFPKIVRPARLIMVARYLEHTPAGTALDAIEQKLYAFLWKVPEDIHQQTMQVLRKEFGGQPLDRSFDLEIAFWTRDQLGGLAGRPA